jgi:cytochrome bd-type quinol oxidase subunit 1
MPRFWTRTRRYMTLLWLGTIGLELVVLMLASRTNNSWFLVLALAILALPILAMDATWRWVSRPPRKRWKRHDLEEALAAEARLAAAAAAQPAAEARAPERLPTAPQGG